MQKKQKNAFFQGCIQGFSKALFFVQNLIMRMHLICQKGVFMKNKKLSPLLLLSLLSFNQSALSVGFFPVEGKNFIVEQPDFLDQGKDECAAYATVGALALAFDLNWNDQWFRRSIIACNNNIFKYIERNSDETQITSFLDSFFKKQGFNKKYWEDCLSKINVENENFKKVYNSGLVKYDLSSLNLFVIHKKMIESYQFDGFDLIKDIKFKPAVFIYNFGAHWISFKFDLKDKSGKLKVTILNSLSGDCRDLDFIQNLIGFFIEKNDCESELKHTKDLESEFEASDKQPLSEEEEFKKIESDDRLYNQASSSSTSCYTNSNDFEEEKKCKLQGPEEGTFLPKDILDYQNYDSETSNVFLADEAIAREFENEELFRNQIQIENDEAIARKLQKEEDARLEQIKKDNEYAKLLQQEQL